MTRTATCAALLALVAGGCKASNPSVPRMAPSQASQSQSDQSQGAQSPTEPSTETSPMQGSSAQAVPAKAPQPIVARAGGRVVYLSELLSAWMMTDSVGLRDLLENVVTSRIVMGEAERLGIKITDELLSSETMRALTELENSLQRSQPGVRLDEWIGRSLGLDPARYRQGIRDDVLRRLLAERVVRQYIYGQPWAEVRVLVTETREEAEAALARVRAGEPFARVAAEDSIDPSGKDGGRIPPIIRNESALSKLAYTTKVGELGGPVQEAKRWLVLRPDEFHEPLRGSWAEIQPAIEASLNERPVAEPEYWLWKLEMDERNPTSLDPFFDLIGDPAPAPRR